jgi:hypothetical protein
MNSQRVAQRVLNIVGFVRVFVARVSLLPPQRSLMPVPVPVRRRFGSTRWLASSRRTGWLTLLVGFVLVAAVPAWAGPRPCWPASRTSPTRRCGRLPARVGGEPANPDFPVVALVNTTGESRVLLLGSMRAMGQTPFDHGSHHPRHGRRPRDYDPDAYVTSAS